MHRQAHSGTVLDCDPFGSKALHTSRHYFLSHRIKEITVDRLSRMPSLVVLDFALSWDLERMM